MAADKSNLLRCSTKLILLYKEYSRGNRKFSALDSINFEVKAGDFVNIICRSGSGKSTLLKK
ncbi:MAG: ATP-binding cassette domain-containing protein [Synergistaceae bacterium]|nr:ATP-binding cassette domain-containing protein [Synergistaceae bacterium]